MTEIKQNSPARDWLEEVPHEEITLPERVFNPEYERQVLPRELYVPEKY